MRLLEAGFSLLCNPTLWLMFGLAVLGVCVFVFDMLDHGMYIGVPALMMTGLLLLVPPKDVPLQHSVLWPLGLYALVVLLFYLASWLYFGRSKKKTKDINDDQDFEDP